MRYAHPGTPGALVSLKSAYGNFIDGKFVEPIGGEFFMNTSPVDGSNIGQFPRSDTKDIDFALDAAHRAADAWGKTSAQHRANLLLQVAGHAVERGRQAGQVVLALHPHALVERTRRQPLRDVPRLPDGGIVADAHREQAGGLSGRPLTARSTELVRDAYRLTRGRVPIVGVGGIFSAEDAYAKIRAGARLVEVGTTNGEVLLSMNNQRAPFDDPDVRRAVAYAVDRKAINEVVYNGLATDTGGAPVPPTDPWFPGRDYYPFDPDKARELLRGRTARSRHRHVRR